MLIELHLKIFQQVQIDKYTVALLGNGFSRIESKDIEINNYSKRIVVNNAGKTRDNQMKI